MEFNPNVSPPDSSKTGASVSFSEWMSVKRSKGKQCAAFDCYKFQYNEEGSRSEVSFFDSP